MSTLYWFVEGSPNAHHIFTHFPFAASKYREIQSVSRDEKEDNETEKDEHDEDQDKEDFEAFLKRIDQLKNSHRMCYEVGEKLGSGSVAYVFHGKEMWGMRREVAIKVISKNYRTPPIPTDMEEYKISNYLNHENIVKMYDVLNDVGKVYFIQELIKGTNLYEYVKTFEHWTPPFMSSVDMSLQVAHAIDHCHSNDVLHLDVKQENVMIQKKSDGTLLCKLCDFGWSVISKPWERLKMSAVGSPLFHPPEIMMGEYFDRSVDVWLIGYLMLELFTGCPKFDHEKEVMYYKNLKLDKEKRNLFWDDVSTTLKERHPHLTEKHIQFVIALLKSTLNVKNTHRVSAPVVVHLLQNFHNVLFEKYC